MLLIYNIGIKIYYLLVLLTSLFNKKAKQWVEGRSGWQKKWKSKEIKSSVWFHFASLGEFEQGKPLMEAYKTKYPDKKILITFFSPSGYEIRKNSPLGDYILYLPLDTKKNAEDFIKIFNPEIVFFNKYEYWFHFFKAIHTQEIPLYVTSAIFRQNQIFFKSYGSFNRQILSFVSHFFLQNKESALLLNSIGIKNYSITGDTRFDSVSNLSKKIKDLPFIIDFKAENELIIAGSTWPEDEDILAKWFLENNKNWKIVFAPHEIKPERITQLANLFNKAEVIKHSEINGQSLSDFKILIIDNIGMLSSLYPYGEIAYIGGGFNKSGIHNTLEAVAWKMPVVFGPYYEKFQEAKDLIEMEAGFSYSTKEEFQSIMDKLINNVNYRNLAAEKAKEYVDKNIGATEKIMNWIS